MQTAVLLFQEADSLSVVGFVYLKVIKQTIGVGCRVQVPLRLYRASHHVHKKPCYTHQYLHYHDILPDSIVVNRWCGFEEYLQASGFPSFGTPGLGVLRRGSTRGFHFKTYNP